MVQVASIGDANANGVPICALAGTLAAEVIQQSYKGINLVLVNSNYVSDLMAALKRGECDGVVLGANDWSRAELDINSNPNCDLVLAGETISPISGSWAHKFDYSAYCTKYVQIVIDSIIVGMITDGTITETWNSAISSSATINCANRKVSGGGVQAMGPGNMSGVIMVYMFFAFVASVLWVVKRVRRKYKEHDDLPQKAENINSHTQAHDLAVGGGGGFSYEGVFDGGDKDRYYDTGRDERSGGVRGGSGHYMDGGHRGVVRPVEEPIWLMEQVSSEKQATV